MEKNINIKKRKRIPRAKVTFEKEAWQRGGLLCGIDEVGRGCLAGPVITAAVVLYPKKVFPLLKDSKLLSHDQRVRAAKWIKTHSWYAYGIVSHHEIDCYNIYQATKIAMCRAVMHLMSQLPQLPQKIVVDAMPLSFTDGPLQFCDIVSIPFAEQQSVSVAAASILAKVKRDELMNIYEKIFPGYALAQHKGYATTIHRYSIFTEGRSIIHRNTFLKDLKEMQGDEYEQQIALFC